MSFSGNSQGKLKSVKLKKIVLKINTSMKKTRKILHVNKGVGKPAEHDATSSHELINRAELRKEAFQMYKASVGKQQLLMMHEPEHQSKSQLQSWNLHLFITTLSVFQNMSLGSFYK